MVDIKWGKPAQWTADGKAPIADASDIDALYVIVRDHGRQLRTNQIVYVGMTTNLPIRFNLHPRADEIRAKRGLTRLSIGTISLSSRRSLWARRNPEKALRQIEHILIWALWPTLLNRQDQYSLPLLAGTNTAEAIPWVIRNIGYRFSGRMPREIVYPWMAIKHGRDHSLK